jgi:hypothetical protein
MEVAAKGGYGNRGRQTVKQKYQEVVHKQAVPPPGLPELVWQLRMGTMEIEAFGGQVGGGRETEKQKCWELVYQWFLPVVFKWWY